MEFLSPEVALYLDKSTIQLCMEYCCDIYGGSPGCYLELLDKLQKQICRIVVPSLSASLENLVYPEKVGSFSLQILLWQMLSELAQLVPLPYSQGRSTCYLIHYMIFLSPFLDVTRMAMSKVSFLSQLEARILCLQNALL